MPVMLEPMVKIRPALLLLVAVLFGCGDNQALPNDAAVLSDVRPIDVRYDAPITNPLRDGGVAELPRRGAEDLSGAV